MTIVDEAFLKKIVSDQQSLIVDKNSDVEIDDFTEQRRIKFMNDLSALVDAYEQKCKYHDWYYAYSDDHRYWMAGEKSIKELIQMGKTLDELGQSFHRQNIYNRYCPWGAENEE